MRITIDELERIEKERKAICDEYVRNAPVYVNGLVFVQSGTDKTDVDYLARKLNRLANKYVGLSYLLIRSTTDSKTAQKKVKHTKKRGRPKKYVTGKKVESHCHCWIVNTKKDLPINTVKSELTKYCVLRRKKRPKMKQQKIQPLTGMFIGKYMDKQADEMHRGGDFDFDYFLDERYTHYEDDF